MGTQLMSTVEARVRETLADPDQDTWTTAQVITAINDAAKLAVGIQGLLNVVEGPVPLVAGEQQVLPAGGLAVIDALGNTSDGSPVTMPEGTLMQEVRRFAARTPSVLVDHWTLDARSKRHFRVWPPNTGTGSLDMRYVAEPPVRAANDPVALDDWTITPLRLIALGILYMLDTERQDLAKAQSYRAEGIQMLQSSLPAQAGNAVPPKSVQTETGA